MQTLPRRHVTACLNYGKNYGDVDKGHRANGFTTDGGFCEYQVNNINTLVAIPDSMSDEEATLVVTAGTAMYGLTELGGLVAGESVVVTGPGPIGLLGVAVAKASAPRRSFSPARATTASRSGSHSAPTTLSMSKAKMPSQPCTGSTAAWVLTMSSNAQARRPQ